jgi:DNA-binding NarL/FixJ family response regulator
MNLRHIEIFHAVYINGSVSGAARALNISQPSVSKTLRHAESLLGFPLFQRTRGRLVATEDAHLLFSEVSEIQDRVHALREAGRNLKRGTAGTLRVSALPSLALAALPTAVVQPGLAGDGAAIRVASGGWHVTGRCGHGNSGGAGPGGRIGGTSTVLAGVVFQRTLDRRAICPWRGHGLPSGAGAAKGRAGPGVGAMIRVFLIDDHELVRTGFRMILSAEPDIEIVGEAASGEEGLAQVRRLKPDVVLCDLHLPGISGLEVTERIGRAAGGSHVIVLSVQQDGPLPRRVLEAGACGYLGKGCPAQELLRAVRDASRGRRYVAGDVARQLALASVDGRGSPFDLLSPREMEVALLLTQGRRMSEIAERLNLSAKTIATHKYRMFDKLGINDTVALARLATQYGVTEPAATG